MKSSGISSRLRRPKTIEEAIKLEMCIGPMVSLPKRTSAVVRDFLAQKFAAEMIEKPGSSDLLTDLFKKIVGQE